jgi:hypothetical protein
MIRLADIIGGVELERRTVVDTTLTFKMRPVTAQWSHKASMGTMTHSDRIVAAIHALSQPAIRPYVNSCLVEQATSLISTRESDANPMSLFTSPAGAHIQVATMAFSLTYFRRLQSRIHFEARSSPFSPHSLLLTSLILSDKYLNDNTPSNKWWARNTKIRDGKGTGFTTAKINTMERGLLGLLDWNLRVDAEELSSEIKWLCRIISWRINKPRLASKQSFPGSGVQQCLKKVEKIHAVKSAALIEQSAQCSICLVKFFSIIKPPPCQHEPCITTWLGSVDVCSLCKLYLGNNSLICQATSW